jgi:uncharacterized protein (TIGR04255 family)
MPFPESNRVRYSKSPLSEVICQVRFPPILRIGAEEPVAFQDEIRSEFPLYEEVQEGTQIPADILREMPKELRQLMPGIDVKRLYDFKSLDNQWTIRLSRDFLALTATNYKVWEEFIERFRGPFEALDKIYSPALYTRVGLRYQNVITRSKLGMENTSWADLLNPQLAGVLGNDILSPNVKGYVQVIEIELPMAQGSVTIRHGLGNIDGSNEVSYLIDSDFYANNIKEGINVERRLNIFNQKSGRLFRWSISTKLHDAMDPAPIE